MTTENKAVHPASDFYRSVDEGLKASPKKLSSKYFYDRIGDRLFQKIMKAEEYYLTDCEYEILQGQTSNILDVCQQASSNFDIVELGSGDATKSIFLLKEWQKRCPDFTYYPIDISSNIIELISEELPRQLPGLRIEGIAEDYLNGLTQLKFDGSRNKLILFLGSSIGNMSYEGAEAFLKTINQVAQEGDLFLIGFDLKKESDTILKAYNDKEGYTKAFNLNLLTRINRELGGDFNLDQFSHYPTYDPETGVCRSYIISLTRQEVMIGDTRYAFEPAEKIAVEISQKFEVEAVHQMMEGIGAKFRKDFFDSKNWFLDSLWQVGA